MKKEPSKGRSFGRKGIGATVGDQAGATAEGQVEKAPVHHHENAALKFDNVEEVDEDPDEPGDKTGDVKTKDIGNGGEAADDGHVTLVEIFERLCGAAGETVLDRISRVAPTLNGHLGNPGKLFARVVEGKCQITDNENFRVAGNGEVWIDLEAADAIGFDAEAISDFACERSCRHASR